MNEWDDVEQYPGEETSEDASYGAEDAPVYEQPVYEQPYEPYGAPEEEAPPQPTILSTNMTVNLICTLGSMSGLLGLFLYFADRRSQAVHRYAVQSAGLLAASAFVSLVLWVLTLALSWIPLLGWLISWLLRIAGLAVGCACVVLRVRMMLHAYRGEAYVLPLVGQSLRAFE